MSSESVIIIQIAINGMLMLRGSFDINKGLL